MTPDQWKQLAEFAGVEMTFTVQPWTPSYDHPNGRTWRPDNEWSDFGPLWVLLERWLLAQECEFDFEMTTPISEFDRALAEGTDRDIMQAGCLLGAAIGAAQEGGGGGG